MKKRIFISGSVHLDILSTITEHAETIDSVGELIFEVGGTAFNVATNLATYKDIDVHFYTAMKKSSISTILISELEKNGITPIIEYDESRIVTGKQIGRAHV